MSRRPQSFASVLFLDRAEADVAETLSAPECSADLALDQIVDSLLSGRAEYRLGPFFVHPLATEEAVVYRQEVFADLDGGPLARDVVAFAERMRSARERWARAAEMRHRYQQRAWLLEAAETYVEAVEGLLADLGRAKVRSRALLGLRDYLSGYVGSEAFGALHRDVTAARQALSEVRYTLLFYATVIRVRRFEEEPDYGAEISAFFARFRRRAGGDHHLNLTGPAVMNRIEEQILDRLAALFPDAFAALDSFCDAHPVWLDEVVARLDREVQFYLAFLELVRRLRSARLPVCYPEVSSRAKAETVSSTYDLALALRALPRPDGPEDVDPSTGGIRLQRVVTNDYHLSGAERIIVVTGPNQGGKTTFARTFGQLHWLAGLGCPVPASQARLFLADKVLCHFERGENLMDLRGKLEDDLVRIHQILEGADGRSVVILNEIFSSTTLRDATALSRAVLGELSELDALGVCVTFVDQLASFDHKTVSMVAGVDSADPTRRTFKLERRAADGQAYAVVLAGRYGLSPDRIRQRLSR